LIKYLSVSTKIKTIISGGVSFSVFVVVVKSEIVSANIKLKTSFFDLKIEILKKTHERVCVL